MGKSESIGKLAEALAKAQGEMQNASKDQSNPAFRSRYASLASFWEAARGPLSKNSLAVVQTTATDADGRMTLITTLAHSSGEWMSGEMIVSTEGARQQGPQAIGSALTYARRYALAAMVGIAPDDDDDGNAASGQQQAARPLPPRPQPQPQQTSEQEFASIPNAGQERKSNGNGKAPHWIDNDDTRQRFWAWAKNNGLSEAEVYAVLNVKHVHDYAGTAADARKALSEYTESRRQAA